MPVSIEQAYYVYNVLQTPKSPLFNAIVNLPILFADVDDQKAHLVRTNEVAPIIIKNCREEFQHVSEFKEPIVYGRIAENMPEHALIQVKH